MSQVNHVFLTAACLFASGVACAQDLPDGARAMIEAARASGDAAQLEAVLNAAKAAFPESISAIEASAAPLAQDVAAAASEQTALSEGAPESTPEDAFDEDVSAAAPPRSKFAKLMNPVAWSGEAELSGAKTTGNSEDETIGFSLDAEQEIGRYSNIFEIDYDLHRTDGDTTKDRLVAAYQIDFDLSDRNFGFGRLEYEKDEFSGFDYRAFAGAGLGRRLFEREAFNWTLEAGPGVRYSVVSDTEEEQTEISARAASDIEILLSDRATLGHKARTLWTQETTTATSEVAVTTEINSHFAMRFSYDVKYETEPPDGVENTDTTTKASLLFSF